MENVMADALLRSVPIANEDAEKLCHGSFGPITAAVPTWYNEISETYMQDRKAWGMISSKILNQTHSQSSHILLDWSTTKYGRTTRGALESVKTIHWSRYIKGDENPRKQRKRKGDKNPRKQKEKERRD
ncbi:unnamed protein product [Dovyalis caffra]|uniref:Uncharacterized protein n=1 Tax=Dovyalis caffra TaxID=77055 RepID=A0AAV1RGW0_9ROSI|nr:unnamed protein product [Dovyalis caffra]